MEDRPIGLRIRRARKAAGITQEKLAEQTGLRTEQVSKYEIGAVTPGAENLGRLAMALGVTVDWLVTERGDGPAPNVPAAE